MTTITREDIIDTLEQASAEIAIGMDAKRLLKLLVTALDAQDLSSASPHLLITLTEAKDFLTRDNDNV